MFPILPRKPSQGRTFLSQVLIFSFFFLQVIVLLYSSKLLLQISVCLVLLMLRSRLTKCFSWRCKKTLLIFNFVCQVVDWLFFFPELNILDRVSDAERPCTSTMGACDSGTLMNNGRTEGSTSTDDLKSNLWNIHITEKSHSHQLQKGKASLTSAISNVPWVKGH